MPFLFPALIQWKKHVPIEVTVFHSNSNYCVREPVVTRKPGENIGEISKEALECRRCEPPVVIRILVNGHIHDRTHYHNAARLQNPKYLIHRSPWELYVLQSLQDENSADRFGWQLNVMKVQHLVYTEAESIITANVFQVRKQRPQISESLLTLHLIGTELRASVNTS